MRKDRGRPPASRLAPLTRHLPFRRALGDCRTAGSSAAKAAKPSHATRTHGWRAFHQSFDRSEDSPTKEVSGLLPGAAKQDFGLGSLDRELSYVPLSPRRKREMFETKSR